MSPADKKSTAAKKSKKAKKVAEETEVEASEEENVEIAFEDSGEGDGDVYEVTDGSVPDKTAPEDKAEDKTPAANAGAVNVSVDLDTWAMESDRIAIEDPLLECLAILSRQNGRRTSVAALTAGLPLSTDGFASPALFARAAERIGMEARLIRRPLETVLNSPSLPCILVLKDKQACILYGVKGGKAQLTFAETPQDKTELDVKDLEERYKDFAFFLSGLAQMDDRAGPALITEQRDWFWSTIKGHKRIYMQVVIATVLINVFALVSPIFIMNVYDRVLPVNAFDTLIVLSIGAGVAMLFDFILKNLRAHFLDAAGRKSDIRISSKIFERIQSLKMAERPPSSGVLADNMREFETLRDFFTSATVTTFVDMPFALLFIFLIWVIGGPIAVVPFVFMMLIIGLGAFLQRPLAKVVEEHAREGAYKSSMLIETLNGLETIKIQAAEGHTQRKWEEIVEKSSLTSVKARAITALGVSFTGFMAALSSILIVVYGAFLASSGAITAGGLIACVILSGRVIAPLAQFAQMITRFNQSKSALIRLDELMLTPVERDGTEGYVSRPNLKGHIEFKDVSFRYPGSEVDALKRVTMDIKPGDRVGIIGAVGCGKTTLQRLVMNLYQPTEGMVQIDGLDVRQMEPGDLRRNIGVAQQDSYLFYGTIRDNITLGHESVPEEAIIRAAELTGVMDFISGSPLGLDTPVGERGSYLSGGQRQSIAIARALLYDPPILILDEPTASIDPKSEKIIMERLHKICKDKTVILITHKTPLLGLVDKLALMDKGFIVAYGERDDIIKNLQEGKYTSAPSKGGR